MKKHYNLKALSQGVKAFMVILMVALVSVGSLFAQGDQYQLVTDNQADWSGTYLLTAPHSSLGTVALSGFSTTSTVYGTFTKLNDFVTGNTIVSNSTTDAMQLTIESTGNGTYTIETANGEFLGWTSGNSLAHAAEASNNNYEWTFYFEDGKLRISNANTSARLLQWNNSSPRFACYTSVQTPCSLYKLNDGESSYAIVPAPAITPISGTYYGAQTVSISASNDATIYYTTDGTTPTVNSTEYTEPFTVDATTTVKAIAVSGEIVSAVATSAYTINIPIEVANIAAFKAVDNTTNIYKITGDVTVIGQYSNKYHTFIQDNTGALYIYGTMAHNYNEGDVISGGVFGTYALYNGLKEMKPVAGLPSAEGVAGTPIQPIVVTLADLNENYADYEGKLVTVYGVTAAQDRTFGTASSTKGANITQGDATVQIYNTWGAITNKQISEGDVLNVTGYVIRYNDNVEIVPRNNNDIIMAVAELPYTLDFDNNVDDGFIIDNATATNKWYVGQATGFDNNKLFISYNGVTNKYNNASSTAYASRTIRIPAAGALLSFDYRVMGEGNYDNLTVSIMKDGEATVLATLNNTNEWTNASYVIHPSLAGVVDLVFTWKNDNAGANQFPAAIDNISVIENPCAQPTNLAATVSGTTATITWTPGEGQNAWVLEYKPADRSEWHTVNTTNTTVTLSDLTGNTDYNVRVKADCGTTNSVWVNANFTVDCQSLVVGDPEDIIMGTSTSTTNNYIWPGYFGWQYSAHLYDMEQYGQVNSIALYLNASSSSPGTMTIWVKEVDNDFAFSSSNTFDQFTNGAQEIFDGAPNTSQAGWVEFPINNFTLNEGKDFLVIIRGVGCSTSGGCAKNARYTSTTSKMWYKSKDSSDPGFNTKGTVSSYRANLKINMTSEVCGDVPACTEPTNLTVSNITTSEAEIAWTAGDDETAWTVEYRPAASENWTVAQTTENNYVLNGLNAGTPYVVRVAANCGTTTSEYVAANFTTEASCLVPTNITNVNNMNNTSLYWTANNGVTAWVVEYKEASAAEWISLNVTNEPTIALANLVNATLYDVRIKAVCDENNASAWANYQFTSDCNLTPIPYVEDFEAYAANTQPDCWTSLNNTWPTNSWPMVYVNNSSSYVHNGSKSLYFKSSSAKPVYAVMPAFEAQNVIVTFFYKNEGTVATNGTLSIGTMTDPTDASTFVELRSFEKINTMTEANVSIYDLNGARIAFRCAGGTGNNFVIGVDDINIVPAPSCATPIDVAISNITGNSADVAWTPVHNETEFAVEYKKVEAANWTTVMVSGTSTTLSLSPTTDYMVRIKAVCSAEDASEYSEVLTLSTPCLGGGDVTIGEGTTTDSNLPFYGLFNYAYSQQIYDAADINLAGEVKSIQFYCSTAPSANSTGGIKIWMANTNKSTFSSNTDYINPSELTLVCEVPTYAYQVGWNNFTLDVPFAYDGTSNLVIAYYEGNGSYASGSFYVHSTTGNKAIYHYSDSQSAVSWSSPSSASGSKGIKAVRNNIILTICPPTGDEVCGIPTNVTVSNVTDHSVDVAWTPAHEETDFTVEFKGADETAWNSVMVSGTSTTLNLNASTNYTVRVKAVCSTGNESDYSEEVTLNTPCQGGANVTIGSGSEDNENIPFYGYYNYSYSQQIYDAADINASGDISAIQFYCTDDLDASKVGNIKIWMANTSKSSFSSSTDYVNPSEMTLVCTLPSYAYHTGWNTITLNQPFSYDGTSNLLLAYYEGKDGYESASFQVHSTSANKAIFHYSDDVEDVSYTDPANADGYSSILQIRNNIKFAICPPIEGACYAPENVIVSNITDHSANVAWTPTHGETNFVVEYKTEEDATWNSVTVNGTSTTLNVMDASSYLVRVKAICSEDSQSDYSDEVSFTTPCLGGGDVTIGTGTSKNNGYLVNNYFKYSYSQQIYKASEIGIAGYINSFAVDYAYSSAMTAKNNVEVYMGLTDKTSFSSTSDWITDGLQLVYTGSLNCSQGWNTFTLDAPFAYDGTSNLVLVVKDMSNGYNSSSYTFNTTSTDSQYLTMFYYSDSNPFSGTQSASTRPFYRNNIQFSICPPAEKDIELVSAEPINDACDLSGAALTITVKNKNVEGDITSFEASYSINNGAMVTEIVTPETPIAVGATYTYTFNNAPVLVNAVNNIDINVYVSGDGNADNNALTLGPINLLTPIELSYAEDFSDVVLGQGGWTVGARNANPVMWSVVNGTPTYTFSDEFNASSYMVSPCIHIPAGQTMISYDYNALDVLPENLVVYVGTSAEPADWTVIGQHNNFSHNNNAYHVDYSFNNEADGIYYIIVKAASVRGSMGVTFDNLNINQALTVTINAGANGTTNPNGEVMVSTGDDLNINIFPNAGYYVSAISVNGLTSVVEENDATVYPFTLSNITENTTVDVAFASRQYKVVKTAITPNGTFVPATTDLVNYGDAHTVTAVAAPHHHLTNMTVSNNPALAGINVTNDVVASGTAYSYTFDHVYADKYVTASFRIDTVGIFYTVTSGNGTIDSRFVVSDETEVPAYFSRYEDYGSRYMATFTPAPGYHVENVNINGVDYGPIPTWDFANIAEAQYVVVAFAPNVYQITTTAFGNGTVSEGATFVYNPENTYTFTAVPAEGYVIGQILRNNQPLYVANPTDTFTQTLTNIMSDYNYVVNFVPSTYTVTASAGLNGNITPNGTLSYNYGDEASYTITANDGYYISSITVDGETTSYTQADGMTTYTETFAFSGANASNHTINATFATYRYSIEVAESAHGTITPGTTVYNYNATPTFAITPEAGYGVADVTVDGESVGAVTSYTFPALTANHTIAATFAQYQYTITANAGNGGTITPSGVANMIAGGSQTYTITAAAGHHIDQVYVDGAPVGAVNTYSFNDVNANHTIYVAFGVNEYVVTVNQPNNGVITPGTTTVAYQATPTFVITPNTGYSVTAITLNGTNVMANATNNNGVYTYTLPAVTANATLTATMTQRTFTITASAGSHGTITPSGTATVNFGATAAYTITPAAGYVVEDVTVDGMTMGAVNAYTFTNVTANHTINATFRLMDCTIPTNMHTNDITMNSATFSWYHPTATSFEVQYKALDAATYTTASVNADSYTVAGLNPGTTYVWMVRANCGGNNYSDWSNGNIFTTLKEIDVDNGIEDHNISDLVKVYASNNNVYIVNNAEVQIENVQIFDVYGKLLYSGNVTNNTEVISMNVATGTYVVRLTTAQGTANYKVYLSK